MPTLVTDQLLSEELIEQRRQSGADRYDEVWEGMYVMHAYPGDEHQKIVNRLSVALTYLVEDSGEGEVRPGVNLAADASDWRHDYRCPDVVVFLNQSTAECHGVFWTGGPALAVEVLSPGDEAREKIDFYGKVGAHELMFIDRDPWRVELWRPQGGVLQLAATAEPDGPAIASGPLPIKLRVVSGEERPQIIVTHADSGREWTV